MEIKRRQFLRGAGLGLIGLLAGPEIAFSKLEVVDDPLQEYKYVAWEDLYRKEWTWDRVSHAVHSVGCVGNCAWKVFSRKGIVLFEEQNAIYPVYAKHTPGKYTYKVMGKDRGEYVRFGALGVVPSASPAGCQKGNVYSDWHKQRDFLKYPLKQMGERGSRNWKRVSWDQALKEIADKVIDIEVEYPGAVYMCWRSFGQLTTAASRRILGLLGGQWINPSPMVGDGYPGGHKVAIGRSCSSLDDWFTSDLIISWTQNFVSQRMPHAHFALEAKYNGAKLIVVDCEQSLTSTKADLYVPVRMGSDSYVGAAICNAIIKERRYDVDYLKELTDFPILIRLDTKKFLTQEDMDPVNGTGKDMQYYMWDQNTNKPVMAPGCLDSSKEMKTLDIAKLGIDPALEGSWRITLPSDAKKGIGGPREIEVTTVFEMVKKGLEKYDYDSPLVSEATGLHPSVIRKMIDLIYESKAIRITNGYNNQRHYDGTQSERLKILVLCLMGQLGTTGCYDQTYEGRKEAGFGMLTDPDQPEVPEFGIKATPKGRGSTPVPILYEDTYGKSIEWSKRYFATSPLKESIGFDVEDMERYMKDAFAKRYLPEIRPPRLYFNYAANYYRSKTNQQWFRKNFLKEVRLYVSNDIRMNSTVQDSDYLFPAANNYESWDTRETTIVVWDHQFGMPVKPMFERKTDPEYCRLLAKAIQERARERGIKPLYLEFWTGSKQKKLTIDLANIHDDFTLKGQIFMDNESTLKWAYENSPDTQLGKERYEKMLKDGFVHVGRDAGLFAYYEPDLPYRPWTWQGVHKMPLKTNTGRFQFYMDHEYWLALNQMTPQPQYTDKWKGGPVKPRRPDGTAYPFSMDYPHAKWGIHSSMRTNEWLLRMQRGEVYCYINPMVMKEYGINDGDMVRIYNHMGEWYARAKPKPGLAPYLIYNEHGWEHYMCVNWTHYNNLNCAFWNPLDMTGDPRGKGHYIYTGNNTNNRIFYETGVDIENVEHKHLGGGTGIGQI